MEADMVTGIAAPATAERVHTVSAQADTAHVVSDGAPPVASRAHHLFSCGHFAFTVPNRSALSAMPVGTPVVIELLDHVGPATDESVRSLVWIRARIGEVPASGVRRVLDAIASANPKPALLDVGHRDRLLMCTVDSAVFADAGGADAVGRPALRDAHPDPFCHQEAAWVEHLQRRHPEMVERLRLHLPRGMRRGRLRLLGLDRYGLQVRVDRPEGRWDVRVPFPRPVDDAAALSKALRALMDCPLRRGLHRRLS